jgi:hypothetical protein
MARNGDDTTRMVRLAAGGLGPSVGLVNCFTQLNRGRADGHRKLLSLPIVVSPAASLLVKLACQTGSCLFPRRSIRRPRRLLQPKIGRPSSRAPRIALQPCRGKWRSCYPPVLSIVVRLSRIVPADISRQVTAIATPRARAAYCFAAYRSRR